MKNLLSALVPVLAHLRAHELVNAKVRVPAVDDLRPRRPRVCVSITTSGGIVSEVRSSEAINVYVLDLDELDEDDVQTELREELEDAQERHVELPIQAW